MLGSGSCDLNAASPHFLFLPHLPSSICILYFLFCILYFVFLILHFRISSGCFVASLDFSIRGQRKSKFVVLHILQLLFVYILSHRTLHIACFCWVMLHCKLWQRRLLQFSCNRFCFKKLNVFSSQLHCRELPSSAACQFALGSALPPSFSLCLRFVCISYLVYCTSILEDGLVTHSFSYKKDDLIQLKRPSEMVVALRYELLTLFRMLLHCFHSDG